MVAGADKRTFQIDKLQKAVDDNPESAEAYMRLGTAWLQAGGASRAEAALRRAVELKPDYDEAWINLAGIRLGRWDFDGCVEINRQVAERSPHLLLAHYNQGLGHLYLRQPEDLVACMRRVLEIDPNHAAGHYHLAVGLLAIDDLEGAQAALTQATHLGHSPAPEFLKALERKIESRDKSSEQTASEDRSE